MFENVLKKLKIATKRSWHASWQDKNSLESDILYEYLLDPEKVDLALAVLLGASDCPPRTYRCRSLMAEARPKTRMAGDKDLFASEATRSLLAGFLPLLVDILHGLSSRHLEFPLILQFKFQENIFPQLCTIFFLWIKGIAWCCKLWNWAGYGKFQMQLELKPILIIPHTSCDFSL